MSLKVNYFPALTGLRAIAAYMVFFYHFLPLPKTTIAGGLLHEGHIGVTIFFVLSGFLICLRYIDRLDFSVHWLGIYVRNRVARIYPMYFIVTCITFALIAMDGTYDGTGKWQDFQGYDKPLTLFLNFTFLRGYFQYFIFTGVAQGWTLTVEEFFYLLAPLLLFGIHQIKKPVAALLGYALVLLAIGSLLVQVLPHRFGLFESATFMLNFTFFGRCIEFLVGIGLALLVRGAKNDLAFKRPTFTYAGIIWMCACVVGLWLLDKQADDILGGTTHPFGIVINNLLLPIGIAAFFGGLIYEQSIVRRLLETKVFVLLGKSSYVFYLIHMGVFEQLVDRYVTHSIFIRFGVLVGLSILLFQLVEEPVHKWLVKRRKTVTVPA